MSLRPVANFAVFGMVVIAPVTHYFYRFLDAAVPPSSSNAVKLQRLLLDRVVLAPLLSLATIVALEVLQVPKAGIRRDLTIALFNDFFKIRAGRLTYPRKFAPV